LKLRVDGTDYDVIDAMQEATLGDLDDLQEATESKTFPGITIPFIRHTFNVVPEKADSITLLGDRDFKRAMMGLIFLSKRNAGEDVTFADVRKVQAKHASFIFDTDELVEPEVPKSAAEENSAQN
jgi:hypothetical protein